MSDIWKPHVVVAAVIERDGRFLLVEEQTDDGLRLNQPAGHLEPGESLLHAVRREVLEETARTFVPAALIAVYRLPATERRPTFIRFTFCGTAGDPRRGRSLDHGIVRADWFDLAQIRACPERHRSPLVGRSIDDYLAGRRYPLDLLQDCPP
jgi:ADP-ribose pyrophosphatase YjhB (NUDIX family)